MKINEINAHVLQLISNRSTKIQINSLLQTCQKLTMSANMRVDLFGKEL